MEGETLLEGAVERLRTRIPDPPEAVIVLGSGLSELVDEVEDPVEIPFEEIPGFPAPSVAGHAGRYVFGRIAGRKVLIQAGRFHYYEGHPSRVVTAPIRCAGLLGAGVAILTNAAGGIDRRLAPGTIVLLDDQLNLQWRSPLAGPVAPGERRFPDMSAPFDPKLAALAEEVALELGVPLPRGVYGGVSGPSYETPAEVRMLAAMGADVVGMSTVPEVIVARARGLRVLGLSLVTNPAAGLGSAPLSHREVLEAGRAAAESMIGVVRGVVARLPAR